MIPLEKITASIRDNVQLIKKIIVTVFSILLIFTFIFTICSNYSMAKRIAKLENELGSLSPSIDKFKEDNEKVVTELTNFNDLKMKILTDIAITKLKLDQFSKAVFNASDSGKGFARLDSSTGMFFLILDKTEQFSDGYKLYFRVGNPQNCVYNGYNIKIRWGKKYNREDKTVSYEDWEKSLKSSDLSFQNILIPGQWSNFEVMISPAKPEEIEYIEVKIQAEQISMQKSE
ncbi:MAG: DUF3251 domain-containing protein [Firmicutes bacterium]|nr:DUF3251 domain-containing protein [Bacillota bacterium]